MDLETSSSTLSHSLALRRWQTRRITVLFDRPLHGLSPPLPSPSHKYLTCAENVGGVNRWAAAAAALVVVVVVPLSTHANLSNLTSGWVNVGFVWEQWVGLWVGLCALSLCAGARHGLWIVSHCEKLLACTPLHDSEPENELCTSQISRKILKRWLFQL